MWSAALPRRYYTASRVTRLRCAPPRSAHQNRQNAPRTNRAIPSPVANPVEPMDHVPILARPPLRPLADRRHTPASTHPLPTRNRQIPKRSLDRHRPISHVRSPPPRPRYPRSPHSPNSTSAPTSLTATNPASGSSVSMPPTRSLSRSHAPGSISPISTQECATKLATTGSSTAANAPMQRR
jgi:hypothetical protein